VASFVDRVEASTEGGDGNTWSEEAMRKHPILGDIRPYNFISPEGREVTAWMSVERDHRAGGASH